MKCPSCKEKDLVAIMTTRISPVSGEPMVELPILGGALNIDYCPNECKKPFEKG